MSRTILLAVAGALLALVVVSAVSAAPPTPTGGASVTGRTYDVGQVLTAHAPSYSSTPDSITFRWSRCTSYGGDVTNVCTEIPGDTGDTHSIVAEDFGYYLRASIDASNADGTATTTATAFPAAGAPNLFMSPTMSNTVDEEGDSLSVSSGTWNVPAGHPATYSYQWVRCPADGPSTGCPSPASIPGATSSSYTVTADDVGHVIGVWVTATDDYGSSSQIAWTGYKIGYPQVSGSSPNYTGHASNEGETVTATNGEWRSPDGSALTFSYQWLLCTGTSQATCSNIAGETGQSYTARASDAGKRLAVDVIATNDVGSTTYWVGLFYVVGGPWLDLSDVPTISGTGHPAEPLTANDGSWFFGTGHPITITYQWYTCNSAVAGPDTLCSQISGETAKTYVVRDGDVGSAIYVVVTAQNDYGRGGWFTDTGVLVTRPSTDSPAGPGQSSTAPSSSTTQTVQPDQSSSVTLAPPAGIASGPASIAWPAGTFGDAPATIAASVVPPQAAPGVEFAAGSAVVQIDATSSSGAPITTLANVLDISIPNAPEGVTPVYQRLDEPWVVIPRLTGNALADGQADGWYRDGTTLHILTRHLTRFALAKALEVRWGVRRKVSLTWAKALPVYAGPSLDANATFVLRKGSNVVGSWSAALPANATAPTRLGLRSKAIVPGTYRLSIVITAGPQRFTQVVTLRFSR